MKLGIKYHDVKKTDFTEIAHPGDFINSITGEILENRRYSTAQYTYTLKVSFTPDNQPTRNYTVKMPPVHIFIHEPTELQEASQYDQMFDRNKLLTVSILPYTDLSKTVTIIHHANEVDHYDEEILNTILNDFNSRDWLLYLITDKKVKKDKELKVTLMKNMIAQ